MSCKFEVYMMHCINGSTTAAGCGEYKIPSAGVGADLSPQTSEPVHLLSVSGLRPRGQAPLTELLSARNGFVESRRIGCQPEIIV
jgi:hypothetical protein